MAVFLLFLLSPVSCLATALAQQSPLYISLGSSLTPTGNSSSWSSHSGLFAFGFYQQGNGYAVGIYLAGIPEKTNMDSQQGQPCFSKQCLTGVIERWKADFAAHTGPGYCYC